MRTLFLDFASHNAASIACVTEGATVAITHVDHRMTDSELMPAVESTMKQAVWTYADLTQLACVTGPGGFTSLRMSAAFLNVLADQLHIPSAGIHLSNVYGARYQRSDIRDQQWVWFHSTRKQELFVRTFGMQDSPWAQPTLVSIDTLLNAALPRPTHFAGELIADHRTALAPLQLQELPLKPLSDVLPALLAAQTYKNDLLLPWYGRSW